MATPTLSPDFQNKPAGPEVVIDPVSFNRNTEKNVIPLTDRTFTGYGTVDTMRLPNRGIMTHLRIVAELSVVTDKGSGAITKRDAWMHGLLKNILVRANGSIIHNIDGMDARVRRQIVTLGASDDISSDTVVVGTDATYTCTVVWDVPLCVDPFSLIGSLFAESDANYFDVQLTYRQKAELFDLTSDADVTITGTIKSAVTTFDVVRTRDAQGRPIIPIPDLSHVFMMQSIDKPLVGNGRQVFDLNKIDGQLLRLYGRIQNGTAAGQDGLPLTGLTTAEWMYGVNQKPQVWTPAKLLEYQNQNDYRSRLPFDYFVFDYVAENAERDSVDPHGVADPQIAIDLGAATVNSNATVHMCEEVLTRAGGFAAVPAYAA